MQAAAVATPPIAPTPVMPAPDAPSSSAGPSDFARQLDMASTAAEPEAAPTTATEEAAPDPTPPTSDVAALLAGLQWLAPQTAELVKQAPEAVGSDEEDNLVFATDAAAAGQATPLSILPVALSAQPLPAQPSPGPAVKAPAFASTAIPATETAPEGRPALDAAAAAPPSIKPPQKSAPMPMPMPVPLPTHRAPEPATQLPTFEMSSSVTRAGVGAGTNKAAEPLTAPLGPQPTPTPNTVATLAVPWLQTFSTAPTADAPFHAALTVALGSPEFAPALSTQVSMLVRNGIGEARLHLHPAELGPINVQIALDGQQAQINMSAEHALTRQALEQALPTLANALRESGLTLSGGGVFQHAPQQGQRDGHGQGQEQEQGQQDTPRGPAQGGLLAAENDPRPQPRVLVQRGAVDVYA